MDDQKQGATCINMEFDHPGDPPLDDNDVVITGMSSLMPGCENLKEWAEKLYNKENMVTADNRRWKYTHPELSQFHGQIPGIERCDTQFFMLNSKNVHVIDPSSRKLLEQTYQALFDAGISPAEVSCKHIGVFIAVSQPESEKFCSRIESGLFGCNRSMYANRISYWMNVTGPSISIDSACSGSVVALESAYNAIMSGQCEAAFVGASKLILHPMTLIHNNRIVPQNFDGKTKCYDINADGQSMSESVSVIYLQKYKDARRVYARLCHVKTGYSQGLDENFMVKFGYYRDPKILSKFLSSFYEDAGVSPSSVEYIEGFGSANPATDKSELQSIEEIYCKQRTDPLLVGSVTSNMGFTESVSALNGVIKILLAYQNGILAANLNCDNPRQDITAIRDGRIKIVTEPHPIRRSYSALNSFSITGINGHVLLGGHFKKKDPSKYACDLPYLVTVSSRQGTGVQRVLDSIKSNNLDSEELALLREVYKMRTSNHMARGFGIFVSDSDNTKTVSLCEKVASFDEIKRPLWFVYSGMGSQWSGMGAQLMRVPIFAAAILRCDKVLKPKGMDIVKIITSKDEKTFDNILNAFVGITAIQIALTDVLLAVGLAPDKMIGHSLGELGCAYADNCLTTEETILLSYSRGLVSVQVPFIKGSMAAVGLGYKEVSKLCPPEIEVACHNGPDSSTLSGPAEVMQNFVKELTKLGIFAKEVNCANIAYHSRYIAKAGPTFLKMGQAIIQTPKLRSQRWVSTSVPVEGWKQYNAMFSSAEYHTNNFLNSVLFEETSRMIPNGAVLVEIAPHGLLQAILKRSLPSDCRNIPLTNRGHSNASVYLLEALGKLFMEGCDVDTRALYPKVEFPVSTKTRQLSHIVEHYHSDRWNVCLYAAPERQFASTYKPIVTLYDDEYKYLMGSVIEGKREFPFAGLLMFVWDTLAMTFGEKVKGISVQFKDLKFYYQPIVEANRPLEFTVTLQKQSGRFEVTEDPNHLVFEGYIRACNSSFFNDSPESNDTLQLSSIDVYKLLYERGYEYTHELRSIQKANLTLTKAKIAWNNNWTTFIDGIFQLILLRHGHNGVSQPTYVKRIMIDVDKHEEAISGKTDMIQASHCEIGDKTRCGGVLIETVILKDKPAKADFDIGYKSLKFVPFTQEYTNVVSNLYVTMQIIAEHFGSSCINVLTINDNPKNNLLNKIKNLCTEPLIKIHVTDVNEAEVINKVHEIEKPDLVFINNEVFNKQVFNQLHHNLSSETFLLMLGVDTKYINPRLFKSVFVAGKKGTKLELFKWAQQQKAETIVYPVRNTSELVRLQNLRKDLSSKQSLTVVTTYPAIPGVKEIVKQLRAEGNFQVNLAMINSNKAELDLKKFHNLDLAVNVFQNGKWGGEYYVPLQKFQSKSDNITLKIGKPGDLNSLQWVEMYKNNEHGALLTVHYAGLNFYNAKQATAEISTKTNSSFGMDFSGLNERKEPIMGLIPEGAACSKINFKSGLLWPVPKHWTLEDAATVPLPYCLAFYCLGIKLKLVRGMNVLIHGGAGALGQAAISIALAHNCTVFTTVSDNAKKRFLRELYPDLPANQIGNSRDESFSDMVRTQTKGEGCEIILSNVKGNLKKATLTCCAKAGTALDMIQIHDNDNFQYRMSFMTKARSYSTVDFTSVFKRNNEDDLKKLRWMVSDGIACGYVRPISRVTYVPSEAPRAFRLLAASRHRGRVLLQLKDQEPVVQPRITCLPESYFLVICDTEGLGLKLADKLISSGARKLHLHLSSPLPHLFYKLRNWKRAGVEVQMSSDKLDDCDSIVTLLKELNENGPVHGIFVIQEQSIIQSSVLLKLDDASRKLCPSLRYFVIVNGQHFAQHICHNRFRIGLPAVSINILLNKFGQINEENNRFGWNSAVNVIEIATQAKEPNTLAYIKHKQEDIIKAITKIPGVFITSATLDRTTLETVGIDHGRSQEFCNILENKFNINKIAKETIPYLTIAQLKHWQTESMIPMGEKPDIGAYFNSIYPDDLIANTDLVLMPTMIKKAEMRADELEIEDTHMFIIPGLEGHHQKFQSLCKRLKIAAAVLQLGYDNKNETIQETAHRFSNVILQKLKYTRRFYLLGYEYGVFVVLEMAAILESYGLTGTVYCLGGSPAEIQADLENRLVGMTGLQLQNDLIQLFCSLASDDCSVDLAKEFSIQRGFEDKVKCCIKKLQCQIPFNSQYLCDIIESAFARIGFIRHYKYDLPSLKATVILIRALPTIPSNFPVAASYDLLVSLKSAPEDLGCPAIINKHLEPHVLKDFSNRNLCESYLINDEDAFMKYGLPDS